MTRVLATNILSPLGLTTAQNYQAVVEGRSALRLHADRWHLPDAFCASLFDTIPIEAGMTRFEGLAVRSVRAALEQLSPCPDISSSRTLFILSSTKGNVEHLDDGLRVALPDAARVIAQAVGVTTDPLVVSNACISGVASLVTAMRALDSGAYDLVIVTGCDVQSKFIVSGFQSFKALSAEPCRPFDLTRIGLNLGEAAATIILQAEPSAEAQGATPTDGWHLLDGAVRNDANHISGPSRTGEGSYLALRDTLAHATRDDLAFVNVHGTATAYNDEMESIAIDRAGLADLPVCALKGYYGHTMGAAGVLETILSMEAVDHGVIPATRGFNTLGVSRHIDITASPRSTDRQAFVKLLSGFGGCNAAILCSKTGRPATPSPRSDASLHLLADVQLSSADGGLGSLTDIYRQRIGDYPKFFKMDVLCRLGFVATELLLADSGAGQPERDADGQLLAREDVDVVLFSRSGSLVDDLHYQATIHDDDFFPSPAVFVYTLPNIVTGEICIRHKWRGESSMYLIERCDWSRMLSLARQTVSHTHARLLLCGWLEARSDDDFEADLRLFDVRTDSL